MHVATLKESHPVSNSIGIALLANGKLMEPPMNTGDTYLMEMGASIRVEQSSVNQGVHTMENITMFFTFLRYCPECIDTMYKRRGWGKQHISPRCTHFWNRPRLE